MKKVVVAYIPVLHDGYVRFLMKHSDAEGVFLLGKEMVAESDYLHKDIRAVDPELMRTAIASLGIVKGIDILYPTTDIHSDILVMPDEDISRTIGEKYFKGRNVVYEPVFLRWDKINGAYKKKVGSEEVITENEFMNRAFRKAERSSDWWRRVGAVIVKEGEILIERYNKHLPTDHQPFVDGDPRSTVHKGEGTLENYTSIHAEAGAIAEAARRGISLSGAHMYATDFPCPVCAKQIAESGITRLYYHRGYAMLDGERVLENAGVKIIRIETAGE